MVLDDGRVTEFGSPQTLLRDPSSKFSKLAAAQGAHASHTPSNPVVIQGVEEME